MLLFTIVLLININKWKQAKNFNIFKTDADKSQDSPLHVECSGVDLE